ncbi:MAG TPA: DUF6489 family protein [Nevskia sp.]|nr:DUF6489 family protein [Nevskia sp.]
MQIKIEIDLKPEELRRFLGLPDVAGLQEDVVQFLREKIGSASESFDPASFVKDNIKTIRNSGAWKKVVAAAKARASSLVPEPPPAPKKRAARKGAPAKPRAARKAAPRKAAKPQAAAAADAPAAEGGPGHEPG